MQTQVRSRITETPRALPETLETLLSVLAGCGLVLMLAFFLSLESWVVSVMGLR